MIPTESFIALVLLMAVSLAFGYFLRVLMDRALEEHRGASTHSTDADHERWEDDPVPTIPCETCKHQDTSLREEPCSGCTSGSFGTMPSKWEDIND